MECCLIIKTQPQFTKLATKKKLKISVLEKLVDLVSY